MDCHHLETVLYNSFSQQGGIPHTDNILVIIIRNAVRIHRIRQGLALPLWKLL